MAEIDRQQILLTNMSTKCSNDLENIYNGIYDDKEEVRNYHQNKTKECDLNALNNVLHEVKYRANQVKLANYRRDLEDFHAKAKKKYDDAVRWGEWGN